MSHTYAELEVSQATYDDITAKLHAAGYVFQTEGGPEHQTLDMDGIGLVRAADAPPTPVLVIQLQKVSSSNIEEVGYDASSKTLAVRFKPRAEGEKGPLWRYFEVPVEKYEEMLRAVSIGRYFGANIKPIHDGRKVVE